MPIRTPPHSSLARSAVEIFTVNDRINQLLIRHLHPSAWLAKPPGKATRTIAAIFTHLHNVRTKWIRLTAPHLKIPPQLHRSRCTRKQAGSALAQSAARCSQMLAEALDGSGGILKFNRDGWARPWPVGPEMLGYMLAHEAHHRGQVCLLAHQLGFPVPKQIAYGIWNWEKLWKDSGFPAGPGASSPAAAKKASR